MVVTGTTFQSVATYTCMTGFKVSTGGLEFNRTCQADETWSEAPPTCVGKFNVHCGHYYGDIKLSI